MHNKIYIAEIIAALLSLDCERNSTMASEVLFEDSLHVVPWSPKAVGCNIKGEKNER